jgi:hypothetical protein
MLHFLYSVEASRRKLRLFGCSCFPAIRHLWQDARIIKGVEIAERYADGSARHSEKEQVRHAAQAVVQEDEDSNAGIVAEAVAALNHNAQTASWCLAMAEGCVAAGWYRGDWWAFRGPDDFLSMCDPARVLARDVVRSAQCDRLRCIFGNPFHPVTADPGWLTASVAALTRRIYHERAFDRLPILADALEEAGCTDPYLLAHCRGPGPHVRGCWPVDALLGKS